MFRLPENLFSTQAKLSRRFISSPPNTHTHTHTHSLTHTQTHTHTHAHINLIPPPAEKGEEKLSETLDLSKVFPTRAYFRHMPILILLHLMYDLSVAFL